MIKLWPVPSPNGTNKELLFVTFDPGRGSRPVMAMDAASRRRPRFAFDDDPDLRSPGSQLYAMLQQYIPEGELSRACDLVSALLGQNGTGDQEPFPTDRSTPGSSRVAQDARARDEFSRRFPDASRLRFCP